MFETINPHDGKLLGQVFWAIAQYERESNQSGMSRLSYS
jgi:hypothetical protein